MESAQAVEIVPNKALIDSVMTANNLRGFFMGTTHLLTSPQKLLFECPKDKN